MVICLERGADLHMAQLMPLPLTVSCFSKIQIGFTFLVPAHPDSPRKRVVKRVCVLICSVLNCSLFAKINLLRKSLERAHCLLLSMSDVGETVAGSSAYLM